MPKLLGEFLQEQQEPFILDVYLLERGYCTRTRPNERFLKIKRRRPTPNCVEVVRRVCRRLVLHNSRKIKNPKNGCGKSIEANDQEHEDDEFSSACATTLYSSCTDSDVEEDAGSSHEVEADTIFFNVRLMKDCDKQLSPISVLEETESKASPLHQIKQYNFKKTKGESSKKPTYKNIQKFEECMDSYDQYSINKRALQQTKKLLVDCVREVIENERKRDDERGQQLKKILGAEELWKVVCENVWLWSQESIHKKNILLLVNSDFLASLQEWDSASDHQKHEVFMEIADAILEDIINEIATGY